MEKLGKLVVISGFSGTGKGTVVKELMKAHDNYSLSVSRTTRKPRNNEIDGVHYIFCTDEEFEKMIKENGFIEYAGYVGKYYGTPRAFVDEQRALGKDVILEIEMQGAMKVKEQYPEAYLIFILPPSFAKLRRRLTERKTETPEEINKRMERAKEELLYIPKYDECMINDDLAECVEKLHKKIMSYQGPEQ